MSTTELDHELDVLTRLAIKHGTDKWGPHFYTPLYHGLFCHLRDRPIRLLEIGVGGYDLKTSGGASLAMWAEYFPNGQITGIDIAEKRLTLDERVRIFRGSQDDSTFIQNVSNERGPFDIIIDDGSHLPKHVVASFNILFPILKDGGIYVIEDVQTAFWPNFGGSTMHGGETVRLTRTIIECLNHAEIAVADRSRPFPEFAKQIKALRAFHNVIVIDKGDNSEPSNFAYDIGNPHAAMAVKAMESQLQNAPTAEGMANLSGLYCLGGNLARAKEVAAEAASRWPTNSTALMAAYAVAVRQKDVAAERKYLDRLLQIEPDNAALQQARAGLNPSVVPSA
ncbi:MAG TPA: class I SAM-dependent methyltransferase [Xanthobacteraceae bacterium]|nr:class I SAM-dependent methyltransferase [Xanthobacteraceae bacterium]